jgi:hypothetical protein
MFRAHAMAAALSVLALACDAAVDDSVPAATFGSGASSGSDPTPFTTGADDGGGDHDDDADDDSTVMGQDGDSDESTSTGDVDDGTTGTSSGGEADDLGPDSSTPTAGNRSMARPTRCTCAPAASPRR